MARQNGIIKLEGTIGDISFYKSQDGMMAYIKKRMVSRLTKGMVLVKAINLGTN